MLGINSTVDIENRSINSFKLMQVKLLSSISILTDFPGTLKREEPVQDKLLEEAKTKKKLV